MWGAFKPGDENVIAAKTCQAGISQVEGALEPSCQVSLAGPVRSNAVSIINSCPSGLFCPHQLTSAVIFGDKRFVISAACQRGPVEHGGAVKGTSYEDIAG